MAIRCAGSAASVPPMSRSPFFLIWVSPQPVGAPLRYDS
ncbi:Uncharacterised protein [Bordetella pertussis]|nr:Uncharacterised protein [Bordetella pertussis]